MQLMRKSLMDKTLQEAAVGQEEEFLRELSEQSLWVCIITAEYLKDDI